MAAPPIPVSEDPALSLTLAVVTSSPAPLLLLDGDLNVVAASRSFTDAYEIDRAAAVGQPMTGLGAGEWDLPALRGLLAAAASGAAEIKANEMQLRRPGRKTRDLLIHIQQLTYLDLENKRLLVAATDVTEARADAKAKDDALRQNLVLLQEVRHRVANSLQIIASVLLQNARRTGSEETRAHLRDAHNRVMSVAALERLLSLSGELEVELRAYFTELCASIAASMIGDQDHIRLAVTGARGLVDARVSVSLGLIVTELVINALKHAFPDGRPGRITVDCAFQGPNWTLSVTDDGVGMPRDPSQVRAGLGSSIVEALAKQLHAVVEITPANPGTCVAVIHTQIALVNDNEGAEEDSPAAAANPPARAGSQ
jgi:two-component sensor histidine kinase